MVLSIQKQEVLYKGLYFPIPTLKRRLLKLLSEDYLKQWCIHRRFNAVTGEIERKYAWDSVLSDLIAKGVLARVLDDIIEEEYLE